MKTYIRLTPVEFPGVAEQPPTYEFVETEDENGNGVGSSSVGWTNAPPDGCGDKYLGPFFTLEDLEDAFNNGRTAAGEGDTTHDGHSEVDGPSILASTAARTGWSVWHSCVQEPDERTGPAGEPSHVVNDGQAHLNPAWHPPEPDEELANARVQWRGMLHNVGADPGDHELNRDTDGRFVVTKSDGSPLTIPNFDLLRRGDAHSEVDGVFNG